ncbi:MAG: hypothetical protein JW744_04745 [Candidatus Diapherotrites archaeon]|uniref:Uncharacterized protein n=1 Tax=Candidatus Iainarchaeum sp. TaxID=3101447 RepID=A0A938YRT4_9ARCH|nr:hypothetical protein [Candidatus Diapherotrites archaeon]
MALELVADILFALIDLVRMSLIVAIPGFLLVLAGQHLFKKLREKFKLNWIQAAGITTYAIVLAIVFIVYLYPFALSFMERAQTGSAPVPIMELTLVDYGVMVFATIAKNLLTALVFTFLLLPLLFFASFASEKIRERHKMPEIANTFVAVFCTAFVSWAIVLFIFPWILNGVLYLLFWSQI